MKRSGSPDRFVLAGDSARLQDEMHRRGLSPPKEYIAPEMLLQRRLEAGRNPLSGIAETIPELKSPLPEELLEKSGDNPEILLSSQRINARILEAWINSTIVDAEHMEIPGTLAKADQQHPLSRYGVDRHSLARAGVANGDIDRLYKALFVYSLGFYQLINKTMEHVAGKYTYVAGVWKVYSILLEYCCKVDYDMAIATVQEEKRTALDQLEAHYKAQVRDWQVKCEKALADVENYSVRLGLLEHERLQEQHRRLELEEEISHRGLGHEEEVGLRIRFEGKLNQMFAQQRDMETREKHRKEQVEKQQGELRDKVTLQGELSGQVRVLAEAKIALEVQVAGLEESLAHTLRINSNLENRLSDYASKIEALKEDYTQAKEKLQLLQSQLLQRSLIIDKLESEKAAIESQLLKVQAVVDGYQRERDQALTRVALLETAFKTDMTKYLTIEQDYVRCKEEEARKDRALVGLKRSIEKSSDELQRTSVQLDTLKVQYDHLVVLTDQQKEQLRQAVSKIEDTTRARHLSEDRVEELKVRLAQTEEAKEVLAGELLAAKKDVDKVRNEIVEVEREFDANEMRQRASERQFDAQKDALMQKIKNLSDILSSERKTRETWIEKFEQEQKANAENMRQAMESRRTLADLQLQLTTQTSRREEATRRLETERRAGVESRKQVLELRGELEAASRKSLTLVHLVETLEEEWRKRVGEVEERAAGELDRERMSALQERMCEEDSRSHACRNLSQAYSFAFARDQAELECERLRARSEDLRGKLLAVVAAVRTKQNSELQAKGADLLLEVDGLKAQHRNKEAEIIEKSLEIQRLSVFASSLREVLST